MTKHGQQQSEHTLGDRPSTLVDHIKDAASSLKDIGGQLWDAAKPMFDHGRTEAAAALFAGHAHVMYMKGQEGPGLTQEQGQDKEPQHHQQQQQSKDGPERDKGGREM